MTDKEFWEKCGLDGKHDMVEYGLHDASLDWCKRCELNGDEIGGECNPSITLDNLFLYAVPKVVGELGRHKATQLLENWSLTVLYHDEDPADAFRKAIEEVL